MIVCGPARRAKKCPFCHKNPATKLCDFEGEPGNTCDAPMCSNCATPIGKDRDLCPMHKAKAEELTHVRHAETQSHQP